MSRIIITPELEQQVVTLSCSGKRRKEICEMLGLHPTTVTHITCDHQEEIDYAFVSRIVNLHNQGMHVRAIARELRTTEHTIANFAKRYGLNLRASHVELPQSPYSVQQPDAPVITWAERNKRVKENCKAAIAYRRNLDWYARSQYKRLMK